VDIIYYWTETNITTK